MSKRLKTIYEYLGNYSKEDIDKVLEGLDEKDKNILFLRYGSDLNNPTTSKEFDREKTTYFYSYLIPKIKKLLPPIDKTKEKNLPREQTTTIEKEKKQETERNTVLLKEDYIKALSFLQSANFSKILCDFSIEEAIIICLKLGYIDGKYFDTQSIAQFLNIDEKRIYQIVHKFLDLYKENVINFIDKIIEGANKDDILVKKLDK